jgi:deoxyadenosine/deoxycytidine kinase
MAQIITLEGNIGAGKTSILKAIEQLKLSKPHIVYFEPVDEWMSFKMEGCNKSLFELYYEDKKQYGFTFQMFALLTRMRHLLNVIETNPNKVIICERCYLTDNEIFAKMLKTDGTITDLDYHVYEAWFRFIESMIRPNIVGILYLRATPNVCVNRIIKRDRAGEDKIDISYIKRLHQQHEDWLINRTNVVGQPVHIINGDVGEGNWDMASVAAFINTCIGLSD